MFIRKTAASALVLLLFGLPTKAQAPPQDQSDALARRAEERLTALKAEADRLTAEERTLLGDLRRLELERQIKDQELRQHDTSAARVSREIRTLDTQIAAIGQQLELEIPKVRARLVGIYKLGQGRYARLLLSAADLRSASQAARTVGALASRDSDRVDLYRQHREELRAARADLEERRREAARLRDSAAQARRAAQAAIEARNSLIADIDQRRDLTAQLAGELQAAQQRLQSTISGLATNGAAPATLPVGPFRGDLPWPVTGTVRQAFGKAARPGSPIVNGLDIAAPEGLAVHAIHEGTVVFAGPFAGFGQMVIVDHGNQAFSLYGNLSETSARTGSRLQRGDTVGSTGAAANGATGLYFELRIDGRPVDPLQWLQSR